MKYTGRSEVSLHPRYRQDRAKVGDTMLINLLPFAFSGDESVTSKTLLQSVVSGSANKHAPCLGNRGNRRK